MIYIIYTYSETYLQKTKSETTNNIEFATKTTNNTQIALNKEYSNNVSI